MNDQVAAFTASCAGGLLWSLVAVVTAIVAPNCNRADVHRALLNGGASMASAAIGGWFVAPGVVYYLHIKEIQLINLIGLMVGLIFWRTLPALINLVSNISLARISSIFGGTTK